MKATLGALTKYHPMIKFIGGPHPIPRNVTSTVHPCAPGNLLPSTASATPINQYSNFGIFQSRNSLSKRFRYHQIDNLEIADIDSGGAAILIH
ncbi:hypothetical protein BRETT_000080 [Brettanomyces bruxellensis]|uniref:Uncharacterized protein n=1 Tax=Dekkera bruxellensis TaxID=5007 RepID=A0A871R1C3_DEKBR|nr:uncharacterized protein BRETT_000080 [Brettanomyces bruxellensis]QOU18354.1 hypothetical protein BRETT_000080 [Brettanomyces bruxellensis]